MVKLLKKSTF